MLSASGPGTVRSLWTWLCGRYHVPQNAFLVVKSDLFRRAVDVCYLWFALDALFVYWMCFWCFVSTGFVFDATLSAQVEQSQLITATAALELLGDRPSDADLNCVPEAELLSIEGEDNTAVKFGVYATRTSSAPALPVPEVMLKFPTSTLTY